MNRFLEILFGLDPGSTKEGGRWSIDWLTSLSGDQWLLSLVLIVATLGGLWLLYRWEARRSSIWLRILFFTIRGAILLLGLAMLLEPVLVQRRDEKIPSHLVVLVDVSPSMEVRDAWLDEAGGNQIATKMKVDGGVQSLRKVTRLELAKKALSGETLNTLSLAGKRVVHVHPFSDRLREETKVENFVDVSASGQTTAIGSGLRQANLAYNGMPLAGALLITDGRSTSGEPLSSVAEEWISKSAPVASLVIGTPEGPRNAVLDQVETNPVVLVRDTNRLTVRVTAKGMKDQPAKILLERRRNGGPWEELERRDIVLGLDGAQQAIDFAFTEERPAKVDFRATLEEAGAELSSDDNVAQTDVRVVRDRMNVLLIAGSAFPEVQFLKNSLYRDRKIELSSWLQSADDDYDHLGDLPIRRLPNTAEELDEYDCVLLYDPNPNAWPQGFPELLANFVSKSGGGLVYVAGEMYTAASFDKQNEPQMDWMKLLPVVREPGLFRSDVQIKLSARNPWRFHLTELGLTDPVFAFAEDREANARVIENLPGMFWHFPVTKAKPGATVLAVHGDPRMRNEHGPEVLMATHLVGPGRVLFVAFDSTYRWRYVSEQTFDGFWARTVDRAGRSKQLGGVYPFRLSTPQPSYAPGSEVKVIARFLDPSQVDASTAALNGEVEHGDQDAQPMTLSPSGTPGEFAGSFPADTAGQYTVRVWLGDESAARTAKATTLRIDVKTPSIEVENLGIDRASLETLANATSGKVFDLGQLDKIGSAFPMADVTRVIENRQEIWDAPILWGGLFGLLVVEWVLRKRCQLI